DPGPAGALGPGPRGPRPARRPDAHLHAPPRPLGDRPALHRLADGVPVRFPRAVGEADRRPGALGPAAGGDRLLPPPAGPLREAGPARAVPGRPVRALPRG